MIGSRQEESLINTFWETGKEKERTTVFRNTSCDKTDSSVTVHTRASAGLKVHVNANVTLICTHITHTENSFQP